MRKAMCVLMVFLLAAAAAARSEHAADGVTYGSVLTLKECVRRGFQESNFTALARERLKKAKARVKGARARYFPKLYTDFFLGYGVRESRRIYGLETVLEVPLFKGGETKIQNKLARNSQEIAALKVREDAADLCFELKNLYLEALLNRELLKVTKETVFYVESVIEELYPMLESSEITRKNLIRYSVRLEEEKTSVLRYKNKMDMSLYLLRSVMGMKDDERLELATTGMAQINVSTDEMEIADIDGTTAMRLMRKELRRKVLEKDKLKTRRWPRVSLGLRQRFSRDTFIDKNDFEAGVMGKWNIWDFGRLSSEIQREEAECGKFSALIKMERRKKERRLKMLVSRIKNSKAEISYRKELCGAKREEQAGLERKFSAGTITGLEVIESGLALLDAERNRIDAVITYLRTLFEYERELGVFWVNKLANDSFGEKIAGKVFV